jgi:hypothetical protein
VRGKQSGGHGRRSFGDLRYCISRANTLSGPDTIVFGVDGTIDLTHALPDLASDVEIRGPGADQLTVRRAADDYFRIFKVDGGAAVTLFGLTVANGRAQFDGTDVGFGAGVYNLGTLTLSACVVTGNVSYGYGGGIGNKGTLAVTGSVVRGNQAASSGLGAGGGILNTGQLTVSFSTIADNQAISTFDDAAAGGGIYNEGGLVVDSSAVSGNAVRALYHGSALGGGLFNEGVATVRNTTVAGNMATKTIGSNSTSDGAGIANTNVLAVYNSTIAGNTHTTGGSFGGGVYTPPTKPVTLVDTVVADNGAVYGPDLYGSLGAASGFDLFSTSKGGSGYDASDLLDVDPLLGPLQDNGGPTLTMALLSGSPAIDSGDNTDAPEWDQRGPGYPRIVNGTIDRGAFEVQGASGRGRDLSAVDGTQGRGAFSPKPCVLSVPWNPECLAPGKRVYAETRSDSARASSESALSAMMLRGLAAATAAADTVLTDMIWDSGLLG